MEACALALPAVRLAGGVDHEVHVQWRHLLHVIVACRTTDSRGGGGGGGGGGGSGGGVVIIVDAVGAIAPRPPHGRGVAVQGADVLAGGGRPSLVPRLIHGEVVAGLCELDVEGAFREPDAELAGDTRVRVWALLHQLHACAVLHHLAGVLHVPHVVEPFVRPVPALLLVHAAIEPSARREVRGFLQRFAVLPLGALVVVPGEQVLVRQGVVDVVRNEDLRQASAQKEEQQERDEPAATAEPDPLLLRARVMQAVAAIRLHRRRYKTSQSHGPVVFNSRRIDRNLKPGIQLASTAGKRG
jgi:hypothetical protein